VYSTTQTKGRVERRNAVFQDRFVKELRLRRISDMAQANALLESQFLPELNRRYAVKPRDGQDLHRALDAGLALEEILCVAEHRAVGQDWCVRWQNRWLQIGSVHGPMRLPGRRVLIKQLADGRLLIDHKGQRLSFEEIKAKPPAVKAKRVIVNNRRHKPAATHPWSREPAVGSRPLLKPAPAAPPRASAAEKRKAG
jgi:DNA polymerase III epsilon subunit-like protein